MPWTPNPGPQMLAHSSPAYELLYGGAAGGGKTDFLIVEATRHADNPSHRAIIFRRTFPMLQQPGGIIDRSRELYQNHATYNAEAKRWSFPSGASVTFGHMQRESDKYDYQGGQFTFVGFDQVEQFSEAQFEYIVSRTRSAAGIPVRIRATANPPSEDLTGVKDLWWIKRRYLPWVGSDEELQKTGLPRANAGQHFWYVRDTSGTEFCCGTDRETARKKHQEVVEQMQERQGREIPMMEPATRTFVPATLWDNPHLLRNDPNYLTRLMSLPLLQRQRLLYGDWSIQAAGNVFKRDWFSRVVAAAPLGLQWFRYWDLAISQKTQADYTACAACAFDESDGSLYIRNMIRGKWTWPEQRDIMRATMLAEASLGTAHGIEQSLHGLAAVQELLTERDLVDIPIKAVTVEKDKLTRALAWSYRAEKQMVLVAGPWIPDFIDECVVFDGRGKGHDDQVDAVSGCMMMMAEPMWREMPFLHV